MKSLDIFLKALTNITGNSYAPRLEVKPSKFGAIKIFTIEIWLIRGKKDKELVYTNSSTENVTTPEGKEKVIDSLVVDTMTNIMKLYGIK